MDKAPFSLAESELSADTNLHRYLRGPVSKICVCQGLSLRGEIDAPGDPPGPCPHAPGAFPPPQLMLRL